MLLSVTHKETDQLSVAQKETDQLSVTHKETGSPTILSPDQFSLLGSRYDTLTQEYSICQHFPT